MIYNEPIKLKTEDIILKKTILNKSLKKVMAIALSIISMVGLASCGAGDVGREGYNPSSTTETESKYEKPVEEYDQTFDGMLECMKDRGYIQGVPMTMSADLIGATRGYRYKYTFEKSNITVEFYEYDLNNLSDRANEVINQVKNDKTFSMNDDTVSAVLSNNCSCLMIYNYSKDDEANQQRLTDVENLLKEFKTL